MFFYTVSFPSAVWYLFGGPSVDSARGNLLRTFPQTSNLVLRARESGRQRERHFLQKCHPGTPLAHRHTPLTQLPFPEIIPLKPVEVSAPVDASIDARKGGCHGATFISTRMPTTCLEPGLTDLAPHLPRNTPGKAYAPAACPTPAVTLMKRLVTEP